MNADPKIEFYRQAYLRLRPIVETGGFFTLDNLENLSRSLRRLLRHAQGRMVLQQVKALQEQGCFWHLGKRIPIDKKDTRAWIDLLTASLTQLIRSDTEEIDNIRLFALLTASRIETPLGYYFFKILEPLVKSRFADVDFVPSETTQVMSERDVYRAIESTYQNHAPLLANQWGYLELFNRQMEYPRNGGQSWPVDQTIPYGLSIRNYFARKMRMELSKPYYGEFPRNVNRNERLRQFTKYAYEVFLESCLLVLQQVLQGVQDLGSYKNQATEVPIEQLAAITTIIELSNFFYSDRTARFGSVAAFLQDFIARLEKQGHRYLREWGEIKVCLNSVVSLHLQSELTDIEVIRGVSGTPDAHAQMGEADLTRFRERFVRNGTPEPASLIDELTWPQNYLYVLDGERYHSHCANEFLQLIDEITWNAEELCKGAALYRDLDSRVQTILNRLSVRNYAYRQMATTTLKELIKFVLAMVDGSLAAKKGALSQGSGDEEQQYYQWLSDKTCLINLFKPKTVQTFAAPKVNPVSQAKPQSNQGMIESAQPVPQASQPSSQGTHSVPQGVHPSPQGTQPAASQDAQPAPHDPQSLSKELSRDYGLFTSPVTGLAIKDRSLLLGMLFLSRFPVNKAPLLQGDSLLSCLVGQKRFGLLKETKERFALRLELGDDRQIRSPSARCLEKIQSRSL